MPPRRKNTIRQCLLDLDVDDPSVFGSTTREEEFKILKKIYFRKVLQCHPDKGGDPDVFRKVQTSFELLRNLHSGGKGGHWLFVECMTGTAAASAGSASTNESRDEEEYDMADYDADFSNMETPSWEYYQQAAEEAVPIYRVELAKSDRSKCSQKGAAKRCFVDTHPEEPDAATGTLLDLAVEIIEKDELRIGSINDQSGTYGRWCHLRCWRIPHKVWLGLPDPKICQEPRPFELALARMNQVLLSGFSELPDTEKQAIVRHAMDTSKWAKPRKQKAPATSKTASNSDAAASVSTVTEEDIKMPAAASAQKASKGAVVAAGKQRYVAPIPGQNGAQPNALAGKTFVMTGVFPEMGGGAGLSLGKEKTKAMIISFGGRVTGSVSGKTDVLLVGKEPGMSKVSKARASSKVLLVSLMDLKQGLDDGNSCLEDFPVFSKEEPMKIKDFSMGYAKSGGHNGLALSASKKELAIAQGLIVPKKKRPVASLENGPIALDNGGEQKPEAKKRKPLPESTKQANSQPTKTKAPSAAATKKTAKKPAKTTATKAKKPPPKEQSASTEESTALVVAPTKRRSTRTRSAPKTYC